MRRVLVASAAVHVLAIACILHVKPAPPPVATPHDEEVALDLEELSTAEPEPRAEDAPAQAAPAAVAMVERSPRRSDLGAAPASPTDEAPPDTAPYASNGTMIVFAPNIGLGAPNAANPFLMRGALPEVVAPRGSGSATPDAFYVPENKRAEQAVKDALRAHDSSIGLSVEGPVMHALEDATHAGFAPDRGSATFMAVIDERGLVIDLQVLGTHDRGWDDVRARAVKSLASAKIDLRGVKRAELKIEVTSDVLTAAGSKPDQKYVVTGDRKRTVIESAAPESPSGASVVEAREVGKFDVTDLAGKPLRVVHAKLVMLVTR